MAMVKRKRERQPTMRVTTTDFPTARSHPRYTRLNQLLRDHGFDDFAEAQCAAFCAKTIGRPSLPPSTYVRLLLIGYVEGVDSERGIAWRAADSFALAPGTACWGERHGARPPAGAFADVKGEIVSALRDECDKSTSCPDS